MSSVSRFAPPEEPTGQADSPQSETISEAVRNLFNALPKPEQERLLRQLTEILNPIPTPRAGEVLGTIVKLLPQKRTWTVANVKTELAATGVEAAPKEVYNAIGYLARKGHVQRVGYGRYRLAGAGIITAEDLGGQPNQYEDD